LGRMSDSTGSYMYTRDVNASKVNSSLFREGLKRAFDIVVSILGLLILSPFFILIALRLRNDSPGPLFFKGRRMGRWGEEFKILKFRTMYERPESYEGSKVTAKGDERITPFGKWMRETKINELPQLWNVLVGDMSMVGPRPEDPDIAATWPVDVRAEVLSVRPGITSPASILYRDEESLLIGTSIMDEYLQSILPEKLRLDQLYIRNHGFLSDLDVIFMTLIVLLPKIYGLDVDEAKIFSGPLYNFASRYFTWYLLDTVVAFIAISITGVVWRLSAPLNLGVGRALVVAAAVAVLLGFTNMLFGMKRITWRYASPAYVVDLGLSTGLTLFLLGMLDYYLFDPPLVPLRMIWDFGVLTFVGFVAVRYRERLLTGLASRWMAFRGRTASMGERLLIVGAGSIGELAVWLFKKSKLSDMFSIAGFVDDDFHKQNYKINSYPILGTTRDIPEIVSENQIGIIMFAISKCTEADRDRMLGICRGTNARVVIIPDLMRALEKSMEQLIDSDVEQRR
jgi:lipopolysaccharide/colanic/teichoic acid biosynthesis glycosyltransferase